MVRAVWEWAGLTGPPILSAVTGVYVLRVERERKREREREREVRRFIGESCVREMDGAVLSLESDRLDQE